ncbi:MAG TPA: hypothetical protein VFQ86_08055, partial [Arachidicoccus soli]|nr:hypothetical protein [Arachidicoccus soli]
MRKTTENFPQVLFIYKHKYKMDNLYKKFSIWVLIISPLLVYWPTFSNQFQMHWDDWWVVMNDYTENGINKDNLIQIFVQFYHGQYAPLNETYYLLLYNIFGYNAFVFHFASLLIHMCNVVLVFFLIKRLLQFSFSLKASSVLRVSFITALLMSIHPFSVEPVAWIAASKCLLYTLFYLLALHTYLSFIIKQKWFFYVSTLFLFVLSFGSKEQAITLPGCLLLFDFITKRSIRNTTVWLEKLPFLIFAFVFIVVTFLSQKQNVDGILSHSITYPWYQNVVFASY